MGAIAASTAQSSRYVIEWLSKSIADTTANFTHTDPIAVRTVAPPCQGPYAAWRAVGSSGAPVVSSGAPVENKCSWRSSICRPVRTANYGWLWLAHPIAVWMIAPRRQGANAAGEVLIPTCHDGDLRMAIAQRPVTRFQFGWLLLHAMSATSDPMAVRMIAPCCQST